MTNDNCMHGVAAEFADAPSLKAAAQQARDAGYDNVDAYTPYYVEGLSEILGERPGPAPYIVLAALFVGAGFFFWFQQYLSTEAYPFIIAGRPLNSWQSFTILTFEVGILFAGVTAALTMFFRTGLPQPYHPIFNAENIDLASSSRYFLCIRTTDPQFHLQKTTDFLKEMGPLNVSEVTC